MVQRNRLRQYGHVARKDMNEWVIKCMNYEVKCVRDSEKHCVISDNSEAMDQFVCPYSFLTLELYKLLTH